jgi:hypothetical protein
MKTLKVGALLVLICLGIGFGLQVEHAQQTPQAELTRQAELARKADCAQMAQEDEQATREEQKALAAGKQIFVDGRAGRQAALAAAGCADEDL